MCPAVSLKMYCYVPVFTTTVHSDFAISAMLGLVVLVVYDN